MKTPQMRVIELERKGELETILADLFHELGTMEAVAENLGIHRVTLSGWLDTLGAEVETRRRTTIRFPSSRLRSRQTHL
ncbi:MAG TPA: hypothetical protein VIM84_10505 [Gemmatimonadales bacterium]